MSVPNHHLDLRVSEEDGVFVLRAPDVGYFTAPLVRGAVVAPGMDAGALQRLGGTASLRVPDGVRGAVISDPRERVLAAVGYGDVLYRIDPAGVTTSTTRGPPGSASSHSPTSEPRSPAFASIAFLS